MFGHELMQLESASAQSHISLTNLSSIVDQERNVI